MKIDSRQQAAGSRMGRRARAVLLLLSAACCLLPQVATACPVCFGNSSSPLAKGTDNGILFLLVIVGLVQLGFISLFVTFWLRARALRRRRESFQLIEGGVH